MEKRDSSSIIILMADDDPEDQMLAADALEEARINNEIHFVQDGEQLMDYLCRKGDYEKLSATPLPGLILLDLNMPRKDGREALKEIKENPRLRHIPIVVLTTSQADADIARTYASGVNSFITKPVTFEGLVDVMSTIGRYWFSIVALPPEIYDDDDA